MFGYKIRVYHRDIKKICTNCYDDGHTRQDCSNEKKEWMHAVVDFITKNDDIPDELFGRWLSLARDFVEKNEHIFEHPETTETINDRQSTTEINSEHEYDDHFYDAIQSPDEMMPGVNEIVQNIESRTNRKSKLNPLPTEGKSKRKNRK